MKNKIFRKTMSLVLALAVILSAMSCLMFVSVSAAQDYANLSKTFDFENATDVNAFIQVGGKTGNETAEGYESWNYDPEVAWVSALEKYTINKAELDYANDETIAVVTRKALLAKPYLNTTEGATYQLSNTAVSATSNVPHHLGNTSMFVLKDTVDENGVALDTIKKDKVTGKFSMDYYESAGKNAWNLIETSPILVYYYKDAKNWRGVRFNSYAISETPAFNRLTYQHIICESREVEGEEVVYYYQEGTGRGTTSATYSDTFMDASLYKNHVIDPSLLPETPSWYNVMGRDRVEANVAGYPTAKGNYFASSIPAEKRLGEWLNFEIDYSLKNAVRITLTDATGFPFQLFYSQRTTGKAYDVNGNAITISNDIDFSSGTFAIGSTFALGNNTKKPVDSRTEQTKSIAFDDIKAEMTDSGETSVTSVISAIAAIADESSYNAAKAAFANLTDSQKVRVSNATDLNKWEKYFAAKRISYDFSEDWHADALSAIWPSSANTDSGKWGSYDVIVRQRIVNEDGSNKLRVSYGYETYAGKTVTYTSLPANLLSEVESVAISFKIHNNAAYYSTNAPDALAYLDANYHLADRNKVSKFIKDGTKGYRYLGAIGWAGSKALDMPIDWNSTMQLNLTPDGSKTKISFKGTEMIDPDGDGVYEASANTNYETGSYASSYGVDKIGFTFACSAIIIDSIDVKFKGWDSVINLTAEEEALAARIEAIPEITINNYTTVNTEVSAIRAAVDALGTTALADKKAEGSEFTYLELLAAAEAKIAVFTGDVAAAQAFANTNNAILNTIAANVDTTNAQTIIDVHTAYEALTDAVKSILANNYALLDNAATGEKFGFDVVANLKEIYDIAIPLCPTAAQLAFLEHYEQNGIGALTAAEGKMDVLDASMALYNAVEETHKPNVQAKYEYVLALLDKHFIEDNEFTYNAADIEGLENITAYFNNSVFTQSTAANDENRTRNNKIVNPDKFDATSSTHFTLAQEYGSYIAAGTWYNTEYGFDMLPWVNSLPGINPDNSSRSSWNENYLYLTAYTRSNKPTIYVNGVDVIPDGGPNGGVLVPYYCNAFGASTQQYHSGGSSNTLIGTGEYNMGYMYESSKYVYDPATGYYRLPHSRMVYDMDYSVSVNPNFVGKDGKTYTRVTITFENFRIWMEMADDTTPYVFDKEEGSTDYSLGQNIGGTLSYTYEEDEVLLPQLRLDDKALKYTDYIKITRETTLTEEYEEVLDKTYTEQDADEVVELAKVYNTLTTTDKFINAELVEKIETAITDAGLRPASKGSTLSVGANTSIGFRAVKPAVSNYDKFGIIVTTFNRMNTKGDKELTLADVNNSYAKAYAMDYTEGANRSEELTFNVYGLFDDEEDDQNKKWGVWLVARYYTVYTADDGTEVTIYSTNDFGNTPTSNKTDEAEAAAENAMLQAIAANGQLIRSVNGNIKAMATTLFAAKETYKNEVGIDYVNGLGENMTDYTGKTLAEAYGDDDNGMLSTAEATLYLMKAFKGVFTKILEANS